MIRETTVARNYAEALLELARKDGEPELYAERLGQIADLVVAERDLRLFLETPSIEAGAKKRVIRSVLEGRVPERFLRFLLIVIDKRRTRALPEMAEEFAGLVNQQLGRQRVEITTAMEPDRALKTALKERLGRLLGKEILPDYRVNPRIIGGIVVKVGDRIMDGSVRNRLRALRLRLLKTEIG